MKVLLIDDEQYANEFMTSYLKREGFCVSSATSGEKGLEAARRIRPDLILCDIRMDGMGGLNFAMEIKSSDLRHIKLIALTGMGLEADQEAGKLAGFDHYLLKPVNMDTFAQKLREFL